MKNTLKQMLSSLFGILITAMAVSQFLLPNKVVCGGLSGLSTVLYYMISLPPALTFIPINLILLIISFKALGREFAFKSVWGALLLPCAIQALSYLPPITNDVFLAAVFGGLLYGFGIGITFASGFTTGGTDILARLIQYKFPYIPIGKLLLAADGMVIFMSLLTFKKIDLALFGILTLIIESHSIDLLICRLNISRIAFVITDKGEEITKRLVSDSPRGVTLLDVKGGYTSENKKMLFCALKDSEADKFQTRILETDSEAFVVFSEAKQIVGNGFRVYR